MGRGRVKHKGPRNFTPDFSLAPVCFVLRDPLVDEKAVLLVRWSRLREGTPGDGDRIYGISDTFP